LVATSVTIVDGKFSEGELATVEVIRRVAEVKIIIPIIDSNCFESIRDVSFLM